MQLSCGCVLFTAMYNSYNSDNLPSTRQGIDRSLSAFENKTSSLLTKSVYETVFVSFSYKYTCKKTKPRNQKVLTQCVFIHVGRKTFPDYL